MIWHHFLQHFRYPWVLLLLLVPFGLLIARAFYKPKRSVAYPLSYVPKDTFSLRKLGTQWLATVCYTMALAFMVIALARPVRLDKTPLPPTEGVDIMLLMDASGSMQNQDFEPNRFVASQLTAQRFIDKRPMDRIGLVVFAKQAMLQAPLTLDHQALQEYVAGMYLGMIDPNFTAIGDGLGVAANHLKDSKAKSKVIILLTDGDSNAGTIDPVLAAQAAKAYGIRIYTIGAASAPGKTMYSSQEDEINEGLLLEIAQLTGGQFFRAQNAVELNQIYNTINELEKTPFTPPSSIQQQDRFAPFLWAALVLVGVGILAEKLLFIKVPL